MKSPDKKTFVKSQIAKSLFGLLFVKKFDKITISEICDKAMVARASFYRNFETPLDVVKWSCAFSLNGFLKDHRGEDFETFFLAFLKYIEANSAFWEVLMDNNLAYIAREAISEAVSTSLHSDDDDLFEYRVSFISYGMYGWILAWLKSKNRKSPEELLKMIKQHEREPFLLFGNPTETEET